MPTYLVTGANRGLGYGFVTALSSDPANTVIGLVRDKHTADASLEADGIHHVHVLEADIVDEAALQRAAEQASEILGSSGLDVLICNAGYASGATALTSLRDFEDNIGFAIADAQSSIEINVFGTLKTVNAFLPLIGRGSLKKVVAISSGMGDIDLINEAHLANAAPYALSKAALSTLFAKLGAAYEDEGILFMSLCPGLVDTAASLPTSVSEADAARLQAINAKFEKYAPGFKAMTPQEAAAKNLAAIERSSIAGGQGGSFLSHNGTKRWM